MNVPQRMWRGMAARPVVPHCARLGMAVLLTLGLALALGACEPRHHNPSSVSPLLNPEREAPQYRHLVLDNGMRVLLVSDPRTDRSGASISVGVGSLKDPPNRPGLAHFLEHMLFLGTEKYPQPGSYQTFMSSHAGYSNAYTGDDLTNFHFEVANSAFAQGLDRFSQFFIAPTLDTKYAQLELNAVDSEHAKNVENDYWRTRQIQRDQYRADHPLHHFSTGDKSTLGGVGREELEAFYKQHYSANLMTLAMVSNASLDQQEQWARQMFSAVPNRHLPENRFPPVYLDPKPALRVITVEPVADVRSLTIEFPMPAVESYFRSKPLSLIGFVLGHEGKGSLLSRLKAAGLASSLSAGTGESTVDYASFTLSIGLTPQGLAHYQEVLDDVMGAIKDLRQAGIPKYLYDENQTMAALAFRYREPAGAAQTASNLSALMQEMPYDQLPAVAYLYEDYRPDLYSMLLGRMTPDNMLVTLTAKGLPTTHVEPYYHARYGYEELTGVPYEKLVKADSLAGWHLPDPNPFIPKDTAVIHPQGALKITDATMNYLRADGVPAAVVEKIVPYLDITFTSGEALVKQMRDALSADEQQRYLPLVLKDCLAIPSRLMDSGMGKIWYLPDWRFRQPKAEVVLKMYTDSAYRSPREAVLARLYEASLAEALDEFGYPVREAGLNFDVGTSKSGFIIRFGGYSSGLLALMDRLSGRLTQIDLSPERFAAVKDRMRRGLENRRFDQPYEQAGYYRGLLLDRPAVSWEAQLAALGDITLGDVQQYAQTVYKRVYVEGVVVGNLDPQQARVAIDQLLARLGSTPLPPELRVEERVRELPPRADQVFSDRLDVNNSVIDAYYQVGKTEPRLRGALLIIGRRLQDSYYQSLRTQQQLGYIVWAGMGETRKTLNLSFLVQSGAYPADLLLDRTEQFIPRFIADFKAMPDAAFESYRTSVIQAKLERDHNLGEVAQRLFWVAFQNDGKWDYNSEAIRAVEALKRPYVEQVLHDYLEGSRRRRLVIRLTGKGHKAGRPKGQVITLPAAMGNAVAH